NDNMYDVRQVSDLCVELCKEVKRVGRLTDRELESAEGNQATFRTSSPGCQLQGHSSSVCSASRTRRTSRGLRPTFMSVTETWRMMPCGSTRKVARMATPSSGCRIPSLELSSRL